MKCEEKCRYKTKAIAQMKASRTMNYNPGLKLRVYKCPECRQWHMTKCRQWHMTKR